jgi:hypothetical protein
MDDRLQEIIGIGMAGHGELFYLPHILCGFFRRGGIDIKSCPPLEPSHLDQLGHDLKMPMVMVTVQLWGKGGVDDVVIRRVFEHPVHSVERIREDLGGMFIQGGFHMLETGIMDFGKNPCLKWKSGGKRGDGEEGLVFADDTAFLLKLLSDDITEDTPVFILKIGFGPFDLFGHPSWNNRKGDDLRVGMLQRGPSRNPLVFEDEDISKSLVTPQIDHPRAVGPEDILYTL